MTRHVSSWILFATQLLVVAATIGQPLIETFVSGVGDDANPCIRTAPCKTWAGAISKTPAGGTITAIDPGGFGAVTITKSITLDGSTWIAGILVSGTNGVVISAPGATVILRNLDFMGGAGTPGLSGINIIDAAYVELDNLDINGFATTGIQIVSTATRVSISNCRIVSNAIGILQGTNGTSSPQLQLNIDQSTIAQSFSAGVNIFSGSAVISDSAVSQNPGPGVYLGSSVNGDLFNNVIGGNGVGLHVDVSSSARVEGNLFAANTVDLECQSTLTLNTNNILSNNNLPTTC